MTKPIKSPMGKDILKTRNKQFSQIVSQAYARFCRFYPPFPTTYEILVLDDFVKSLLLPKPIYEYTDKQLAKIFHIHISYVSEEDIPSNTHSIIKPIRDIRYNAEIIVREKDGKFTNALLKEIAYYLVFHENDGKLKRTHKRSFNEMQSKETILRDTMLGLITIPEDTVRMIITDRNKNPKASIHKLEQSVLKNKKISMEILNRRINDFQKVYSAGTLFEMKHIADRTTFLPSTRRICHNFRNCINSKQPK